jgi:hypothetical protein
VSKPTARELLAKCQSGHPLYDRMQPTADLAARVEKVLELHQPTGTGRYKVCQHCLDDVVGSDGWPCFTRRILDGEEEP